MLPIIACVIRPRVEILTNKYKPYLNLKNINNYIYKTVWHKYTFVNSTHKVHTENVDFLIAKDKKDARIKQHWQSLIYSRIYAPWFV